MADTNNNKVMAVLCYLGILWIIPLITDYKNDPFVKFHINQGILLSILSVAIWILGFIPWLGNIISWLGGIAVLVLAVVGIINSVNMEEKPLPVIGTLYTIYK